MRTTKLRYSEFAHLIDVDAFEEGIDWAPEETDHKGNDIGFCPDPWGLHKNGDTTGKFAIHRDKRVYNCWICGGGSLLSLAMAVKDFEEEDALDFLFQFTAPADQSADEFMSQIDALLTVEKAKKKVMPWFNEHVLDQWASDVWIPEPETWCRDRGISPGVRTKYLVGYDRQHKRRSRTHGEYVGPAIILPHFWGGRLVGWQERWLDDDRPEWIPKYTNTHDFPREFTLFNYEQVYFSSKPLVVVESVPTMLFLESIGIPAVGTFGSNVTAEQIRLLRKCQQGLILAYDNDAAGRKWIDSNPKRPDSIPLARTLSSFVPVQVLPPVGPDGEGGDLGDLVEDAEFIPAYLDEAEYYM